MILLKIQSQSKPKVLVDKDLINQIDLFLSLHSRPENRLISRFFGRRVLNPAFFSLKIFGAEGAKNDAYYGNVSPSLSKKPCVETITFFRR